MKKHHFSYMLTVLLMLGVGCSKDFFDINNNPNSATSTTPELVLPNALKVTAQYQLTGYTFLCGWMGYWAPSGSYAYSSSDVSSYKQTTDSYTGSWGFFYDNLEDYDYVEKQAIAQNKPFFEGAAKIMKAYVFQQLVDSYNDIPYSDALLGTSSILPAYDKGAAIYTALLAKLDSGVALMQNPTATATSVNDILFQGSTSKWIQFANSLKLRLLIRESNVIDAATATAQVAKITANGGGFLTTDAAVGSGATFYINSAGQQNPTYGYFYTVSGNPTSGGQADYWRAAQFSLTYFQNNEDTAREAAIYTRVKGKFIGNVLGSQNNIPGTGTSSFAKGILKSATQPAVIMTGAESYLLQAEANLRGWLGTSADAETNFKNGVRASFAYLGATDTLKVKYTTGTQIGQDSIVTPLTTAQSADRVTSLPGNKNSNYSACASDAERLACIVRQKWISENSIMPFEAWCDYRRTGYPPDIPLSISPLKDGPNIPVRILYPTSEYSNNAANVGAEGTIDGHTSKVFWMP